MHADWSLWTCSQVFHEGTCSFHLQRLWRFFHLHRLWRLFHVCCTSYEHSMKNKLVSPVGANLDIGTAPQVCLFWFIRSTLPQRSDVLKLYSADSRQCSAAKRHFKRISPLHNPITAGWRRG